MHHGYIFLARERRGVFLSKRERERERNFDDDKKRWEKENCRFVNDSSRLLGARCVGLGRESGTFNGLFLSSPSLVLRATVCHKKKNKRGRGDVFRG